MTEGSFQFSFDSHFLQQESFLDCEDFRPSLCSASGKLIHAMTLILEGESNISICTPDFDLPFPTLIISKIALEAIPPPMVCILLSVFWLRISTSSCDQGPVFGPQLLPLLCCPHYLTMLANSISNLHFYHLFPVPPPSLSPILLQQPQKCSENCQTYLKVLSSYCCLVNLPKA